MKHATTLMALLLAVTGAASAADAPEQRQSISAEHVNLVRLENDKIVDVVYDVQALELEPDPTRGVVFVRVRPGWLAQGHRETAAFFNTATTSVGVTLTADAGASRTVTLRGGAKPVAPDPVQPIGEAALGLPALPAGDYVADIKRLIRKAAGGTLKTLGERPFGQAFAGDEDGAVRHLALAPVKGRRDAWFVRQNAVWVAKRYRVDVVDLMNAHPKTRRVDWPALVADVPGVLAVAGEDAAVRAGGLTRLFVVRAHTGDDRAAALAIVETAREGTSP